MTMVSRITGLLRDSLFARAFGASPYTDAFYIAFRLPNLLRRLFGEGAFSQAFVPILAEYKTQKGEAATRSLVDHVATTLVWATVLVSVVGVIASPLILMAIASGLDGDGFDKGVVMTRLMFPYIACMSFVVLSGAVLNTWREFKIPAFTPVLWNLSSIIFSLFLVKYFEVPIYSMAVAVMVGGVAQIAIQIPALKRIGMLPRLSFNPLSGLKDPGVRRILKKMGPAVFAVSAAQISLLINTNYASNMGGGAVSVLQYADRLMEFPTGMLGVALGTILLPSLSKANSDGDATEYSALLDWGLRLTLLLALPAAVGLAVLSTPLIAALFNYGEFNAANVAAATAPLMAYAAGLLGIILVKILAPAFYARQDIRTPVRIAIGVLIATQAMNLVFVPLLGVAGLALSIGLGACINALFLFIGLRRRRIYTPHAGWLIFFLKVVAAVVVMGLAAWFSQAQLDWAALRSHPFLRIGALLLIIGFSAAVYFAVLFALGFRPRDFMRRAK
jgi:putative peptidoglycan lipid II flippase